MNYLIDFTSEALSDLKKHMKSGDKKVLLKIDKLLDEIREHPETGTGKPEKLKHYQSSIWSRRISDKHRIVYRIEEEVIIVLVIALWGHYNDK